MVAKKEVSIKIDYADKHVIVTNPFGSVVFDLGEYPETTVTRLALLGLKMEAKRAQDYVALEAQLHSGIFETKNRGRAASAKPRKTDMWLDAIATVFRAIAAKRHAPISAEKASQMARDLTPAQLRSYKRDVDVIVEHAKLTGAPRKSALETAFEPPAAVDEAA